MATIEQQLIQEQKRIDEDLSIGYIKKFEISHATLIPYPIKRICSVYHHIDFVNKGETLRHPLNLSNRVKIESDGKIAIMKSQRSTIIKGDYRCLCSEAVQYKWIVKISTQNGEKVSRQNEIRMGVSSQNITNDKYFDKATGIHYFISSGQKKGKCVVNGNLIQDTYDKYFGIGDVIEMQLDCGRKRLRFCKQTDDNNDNIHLTSHCGIAMHPKLHYYLTLQAQSRGIKFEVLDFIKKIRY